VQRSKDKDLGREKDKGEKEKEKEEEDVVRMKGNKKSANRIVSSDESSSDGSGSSGTYRQCCRSVYSIYGSGSSILTIYGSGSSILTIRIQESH